MGKGKVWGKEGSAQLLQDHFEKSLVSVSVSQVSRDVFVFSIIDYVFNNSNAALSV